MQYTHKGWFYFVPILCAFDDEGGFTDEMSFTGWFFPILLCIYIHNFLCFLHGEGFDFPVYVTGRINGR